MPEVLSAQNRFNALWTTATTVEDSPISAVVVEPYVEGSLRPEVRAVEAQVGDGVIRISNLDAVWRADEDVLIDHLEALESLARTA